MKYPIVVYAPISIALQARYKQLMKEVDTARLEITRVTDLIDKMYELYSKPFTKLVESLKSLQLAIRNHTKGTAVTEAFQSVGDSDVQSIMNTAQLYNANEQLLKAAYRKLAALTHPDKGGNPDLFNAVNLAYKQKNLTYLTDLFIRLTKLNDSLWIQTEGISYAMQELARPKVTLEILRSHPLYAVARFHLIGNTLACSKVMLLFLQQKHITLTNELHSILTGASNGNEDSTGS